MYFEFPPAVYTCKCLFYEFLHPFRIDPVFFWIEMHRLGTIIDFVV